MSPLQVAAPASHLKAAILLDSPLSYWRLNESVGSGTAVDTMSLLNGTYQSAGQNGLGRRAPTQGDSAAGSIALAIGGGGGQQAVSLSSTSALNHGPPFTIECMLMTKASSGAVTFVLLSNPSSPFNGYSLGCGHVTAGQLDVYDSVGGTWRAAVSINDGNWHHIVAVFSASTVTIYKDGVSAGTITLSGAPTPYSGAGALLAVGSNSGPWYMSEVAVYNGALSAARIAAHYQATLSNAPQDRVELLTATQAWEGTAVVEPNLYWDGSKWCMIYRGSWGSQALGYATSSSSDPTIAADWTKYASNPIIGQGHGGVSGFAYVPSIYIESGTLYVTWVESDGNVYMDSGSDALHLSGSPTKVLTQTTGVIGNMWIVKNGSVYVMFFEMRTGSVFHIGYATCSTVNGTYTIQTFPFTISDGNANQGGPWAIIQGGQCALWYHGSYYSGIDLPGQIYRTTTTDLATFGTWSTPVNMIARSHVHEYDQSVDPMLVVPGTSGAPSTGPAYALWDGDDNVNDVASIFINRPAVLPVTP